MEDNPYKDGEMSVDVFAMYLGMKKDSQGLRRSRFSFFFFFFFWSCSNYVIQRKID